MNSILLNILYILLFVFCLSILIVVHELGHLAMAKAFKVYCLEFSVGFGPKLFSFKRKKGETRLSVRAIPFGGYVSMVGEGTEIPEGLTIDDRRSFNKIKKWKRALIMSAGVIMNVVLGFLVFFISESCFMQTSISASSLVVADNSIASNAGLVTGDVVALDSETFGEDASVYVVDKSQAYFTNQDPDTLEETNEEIVVALSRSLSSYDDLSWSDYLRFYRHDVIDDYVHLSDYLLDISDECVSVTFDVSKYIQNTITEEWETTPVTIVLPAQTHLESPDRYFADPGLSLYSEHYWNSFGQASKNTLSLVGESSIAIFKGLGSLFTSPESVGGIIAVGYVSTSTLQNYGLVSFLQLWGLISINLAIINILPFPGLDGWQLFVLLFESISRKELPTKTKNIVSAVGLILLFALMFVLLIKDLIVYVI
ncbi:MAG: site-2 protease family protein [Bacilli bacterium]